MIEEFIDRIIRGDCLEVLPRIPGDSVDFVLTDPPFNVGLEYDATGDSMDDVAYGEWCLRWCGEILRVLKPHRYCVIFTGDKKSYYLFDAIQKSGLIFHHFLKWHKPGCQRALSGTMFFYRTEIAFLCSKSSPNVGIIDRKALFQDTLTYNNTASNVYSYGYFTHNAARPVGLYEQIIRGMCQPNGIVLDIFVGSGTTAIACLKTGRRYIGIDVSEKYCEMSEERIKTARATLLVGESWL